MLDKGSGRRFPMRCDDCRYYVYDEEYQEYYCDVDMDEDDLARLEQSGGRECPFWCSDDEYAVVKHQM